MSEIDTTTTTDVDSGQAQETEQLDTSTTQAVQGDKTSDDTRDQTTVTTEDASADDELTEWASKKGIKTDDPIALLKMVRESEQKMHTATSEAKALKASVQAIGEDDGVGETDNLINRLKVTDFFLNNPEAKSLDDDMAKIVTDKPYLAQDLDVVYALAKEQVRTNLEMKARQEGRKEALAQVAKAEKAAPPKASATTRQSKEETTDADIANMTAAEYVAFKKETGFQPFQV